MGAPIGFINPSLYANSSLFRAIVRGDNRVNSIGYSAGPGWNACTGLGSPNAKAIIDALLQPAVS
jgi:kumamolisin